MAKKCVTNQQKKKVAGSCESNMDNKDQNWNCRWTFAESEIQSFDTVAVEMDPNIAVEQELPNGSWGVPLKMMR